MAYLVPKLSQENIDDLRSSDIIICLETDMALKCRLGLYLIQWTFHNSKDKENTFRTNPMNTFRARLLKSALEKAAIDTYSEVSEFANKAKLEWESIIGLTTLRNHRHYHAHTYLEKFDNKQVKEFIEADKHYKDDIALRIWQVRSSLIQLMLKNGVEVKNPLRIDISSELVELIYEILRSSCKDMGTLTHETINSTLKMFSLVLTAKYAEMFQEDFKQIYSEGPFIL